MAGNKLVYGLHGTVYENICLECGKKYGLDFVMKSEGALFLRRRGEAGL